MSVRSLFKSTSPLLPTHSPRPSTPSSPSRTQPHSPTIPAPILSSRHLQPSSALSIPQPTRPTSPTLSALRRRSSHLQATLQQLLDAQSDGLLISLGHPAAYESSNGSNTPTASVSASSAPGRSRNASRSRAVQQVRGTTSGTMGLKGARRGILTCMRELADIKGLEAELLAVERQGVADVVSQIEGWNGKRSGLDEEIKRIEGERGDDGLVSLEKEDMELGNEIKELQGRLAQLRTRQRLVRRDIEERRNGIDAKLSSFAVSKELVNKQVRQFLKNPPKPTESITIEGDKELLEGFATLPFGRRTLEMAETHFKGIDEVLKQSIENASTEQAALKQGARVWKDVMTSVNTFEKRLRANISSLQNRNDTLLVDEPSSSRTAESEPPTDGSKSLLQAMDATFEDVAERLHLADSNGWNLLVCAIGAEVEAFREGREVLIATFGGRGDEDVIASPMEPPEREEVDASNSDDPLGIGIPDTLHRRESSDRAKGKRAIIDERSESEDDGPGPDLLYERGSEDG